MEILVINGSPKGKYSTTLQTGKYLEILHPEHSFSYLDAGAKIKQYEKDFSAAKAAIEKAELIIFSYPVYTFLVPSQLHRFIELMKASGIDFSGKYVSQISTSMHFYDITAHEFIRENSLDMGLRYIEGLSAEMDDLTKEKGQLEARSFFDHLIWSIDNALYESGRSASPEAKHMPVSVSESSAEKTGDIVIVADLVEDDTQLSDMIRRFSSVCTRNTRLVNIHEFKFKGGCLNCFNCSKDGVCIYNDGFQELLRDTIQSAEAIVLAFSIKDHSMGSVFKTYDDRQFCNGHRTVTMGKAFGYIISGDISREENLRTVIKARAEVGGNYLAGIASDEFEPDREIDKLALNIAYAVDKGYTRPANFYGVGGMKIFRDLIWLMQGVMRADHKFYKAHGQYDFPQKKTGTMLSMYAAGYMMNNKKLKAKLGTKLNDGMLSSYTKVLENAVKTR